MTVPLEVLKAKCSNSYLILKQKISPLEKIINSKERNPQSNQNACSQKPLPQCL